MGDPHATRPVGPSASRSAIQSNTLSLGPKSPKTSQFAVIRRSTVIGSYTSDSYCSSKTVHKSGAGLAKPKKTRDAIIIFKPEIKPIKPMFFYKTDGFFISKICDKS
jgi:hypothetical protein